MYTNNLKKIRTLLNITEEKLAILCEVSNKTIHNIETGKSCPTLTTAYRIKKALQVKNLEDIFPLKNYL